MNKVILMGRLCADPEFRQTQSGTPCCRFRVAIDRPKAKDAQQAETDFINVVAWRARAEFVSRYFSKGSRILVEGAMRNNDYTDNNGVKHYGIEVLAENVEFCESKNAGAAPTDQGQYDQQYQQPAPQQYQQPYNQQYQAPPPQQYQGQYQAPPPQYGSVQPTGAPYPPR